MAILTISEEKLPYHRTEYQPKNGSQTTPIKVEVCKKVVSVLWTENTFKTPEVIFLSPSLAKPIPQKEWTEDMQRFARETAARHPVPNPGKKTALPGKILNATAVLGVLGAILAVSYLMLFKAPGDALSQNDFASFPSKGDRYYGMVNQQIEGQAPSLKYGWVKIAEADPVAKTLTFAPSSSLGDMTFDTMQAEHEAFSSAAQPGTFQAFPDKDKIVIRSQDQSVTFESQVLNSDYAKYKLR